MALAPVDAASHCLAACTPSSDHPQSPGPAVPDEASVRCPLLSGFNEQFVAFSVREAVVSAAAGVLLASAIRLRGAGAAASLRPSWVTDEPANIVRRYGLARGQMVTATHGSDRCPR